MRQAEKLAINLGHQRVKIAGVVAQQAGEGRCIDLFRHCSFVKLEVAGPEPAPVRLILGTQGADQWGRARLRHGDPVLGSCDTLPVRQTLGNGREILTMPQDNRVG